MLEYEKNILGIGISSIGPIDFDRGMILNPPYFYGIHDIPVASLLEDRYSLPVFMDHDNQSAALAELLYGNGKNRDSFMLLGIARGVGCGIVKNGALYVDSRKLGKTCDQHIRKLSVACVYLFDAFFHDESYSFAKTCDARDVERATFIFIRSVFRLVKHL